MAKDKSYAAVPGKRGKKDAAGLGEKYGNKETRDDLDYLVEQILQ